MRNDKIEIARKSWSESLDKDVFQAVDNLDDYEPEIRHIILEEAERRKKDLPAKEKQLKEEEISNYKTLDMGNLVTIAEVESHQVAIIKSALEVHGVTVFVDNANMNNLFGHLTLIPAKIQVSEDQIKKAQRVLQAIKEDEVTEDIEFDDDKETVRKNGCVGDSKKDRKMNDVNAPAKQLISTIYEMGQADPDNPERIIIDDHMFVHLLAIEASNRDVEIRWIGTSYQGEGLGSDILTKITQTADRFAVNLWANFGWLHHCWIVEGDDCGLWGFSYQDSMPERARKLCRLIAWYEKFGFCEDKESGFWVRSGGT